MNPTLIIDGDYFCYRSASASECEVDFSEDLTLVMGDFAEARRIFKQEMKKQKEKLQQQVDALSSSVQSAVAPATVAATDAQSHASFYLTVVNNNSQGQKIAFKVKASTGIEKLISRYSSHVDRGDGHTSRKHQHK